MPSRSIVERLNAGEILILDGATGSELQRRGVDVNQGATKEELGVWSATANLEAPEVVQQVHEDYLRVGADIVTSNNFYTTQATPRRGKQVTSSRFPAPFLVRTEFNLRPHQGSGAVADQLLNPALLCATSRAARRHPSAPGPSGQHEASISVGKSRAKSLPSSAGGA